jgi:hypothetical protein
LGLPALMLNLDPTLGSFTGISYSAERDSSWIGQTVYKIGERSAHLTYLIPADVEDTSALPVLLDGLATQAGNWGAFNVLGEIDEHSTAFEVFRHSGFVVYARQTVWCISRTPENEKQNGSSKWSTASPTDYAAIRTLYNCLVPPLVQSAEQVGEQFKGLVYYQDGEVLAYVEGIFGPRGIYLLPIFHPSLDNVQDLIRSLVQRLSPVLQRPVYLAVRSYQAWLEPILSEIDATEAPRQALLVKHLVHLQREFAYNGRRSVLENRPVEATTPFAPNAHIVLTETQEKIQ